MFLILEIVTMVIMMMGLMGAMCAILFMYTGRSATYDRSAKKMAKATEEAASDIEEE